jgi:Tfp pilus assembly protein PilW
MNSGFSAGRVESRSAISAFTLPEMTMSVGLAAVVGATLLAVTMHTARVFAAIGNYSDLDQASRHAVDLMSRDIRQASALTSFSTNQLVFSDLTNGIFSYTWDSGAGTLTRVYNGASTVLLTGCDSLAFHISQHSPSNNFTFWPANSAASAKLIDVSWTCSRQILGQRLNTESVQTAKIAIRN